MNSTKQITDALAVAHMRGQISSQLVLELLDRLGAGLCPICGDHIRGTQIAVMSFHAPVMLDFIHSDPRILLPCHLSLLQH